MELLFGNRVRSGNRRMGYLAGVEVDVPSRRVTKIIFSADGKLGSHAQARPIEATRVEGGTVVVDSALPGQQTSMQPFLLSRSVRINRSGQDAGRVIGVALGEASALEAIVGRHHWWAGRFRLPAADLDLSTAGEVRARAAAQAA